MRRDCECYAIIGARRVCKTECPVWLVQLPFGELWYVCTIHLETLSKYYYPLTMVPVGWILPATPKKCSA